MGDRIYDEDFGPVRQKEAGVNPPRDLVDGMIYVFNIAVRFPVGLVATPLLLVIIWPNEVIFNPIIFMYVLVANALLGTHKILVR